MSGQQVTNSETNVEHQLNVNVQPGATLILGASNSTSAPAAPREAPAYAFISYAPSTRC